MIVTLEQVQAGLIKYIDTEIAPKATGLMKFALYYVAPSLPKMIGEKIVSFRQDPLFKDMFDENGNIDIELVYKRAKGAMQKSGKLYIERLNYFADEQDIEALYNLIKNS